METTTVYAAEVLALDEAMEVLDEADKRVCIEQQKHAPPQIAQAKEFREHHRQRAQKFRKASAKAKGQKRPRARSVFADNLRMLMTSSSLRPRSSFHQRPPFGGG